MLRPMELAERYLRPFKLKGDEVIPALCPFCHGGKRRDKGTFAMNAQSGTWNCKRGSCGRSGSFLDLCRHFGDQAGPKGFELPRARAKTAYSPPKTRAQTPRDKVEAYLRSRGFSPETWHRRRVGEHDGNIAFPYYEGGKLVLMKFRPARKVGPGERKAWREKGGKPVFWGMDECDPSLPLVIVEGEMDALSLDEAGVANVVSVPSGAEDLTCVDNCWEWLDRFSEVIIWPDNDEPGLQMCRKLISRLGRWRCRVVKSEHKDANEHLQLEGKESTMQAVVNAREVPVAGLVRLADVRAFDPEDTERVRSSIAPLNEEVGGYMMGQLSVWTGTSGSGKSTFLGQELLWSIDQGYNVCAYSGELPAALFRYWVDIQAAGPYHLHEFVERWSGKRRKKPDPAMLPLIREWYRDHFFLYDVFGAPEADALLEVFEYAARRYDCRVFLADNLMTMLMGSSDSDYYRRQSDMVGRLVDFAHRFDAHVHLVAHPRKTQGRLTKMDVSGTGDITNRADNVFAVHRVGKEDKDLRGVCDAVLDVFKCRFSGMQGAEIRMMFDADSKRFYRPSDASPRDHAFGWQRFRVLEGGARP